ncbi:hypothetical protein [Lactiplantibacillus fabifermentans]|uniref:Uncharacterized protein n=1 Tax=Lactiplantibacillus fabifermentans T30PCM01 TaxID=1400520 RepID=W6TA61_9LACO|nr:hypothetical protein [Lactiplantibacillus fabifermentans]ETY75424.1 hypothetical protein LFAB_01855 [Lactiplantibacillus fabifermentans T30PCM01]
MRCNGDRRESGVNAVGFYRVYTTDVFDDLRVVQSIKARFKTAFWLNRSHRGRNYTATPSGKRKRGAYDAIETVMVDD